MRKQRHIYFFLPNFSIGGAGNSIFNICESIKNKSDKLSVISIGQNHYKKNFKKIGVNVIEIFTNKTIFGIIKIYKMMSIISKKNNIIFVSNINYANVLCSIFLVKIKNLKLILVERTPLQELEIYFNFCDFFKKKIIYILAKMFYAKADFIIGNSLNVSSYIKSKFKINVSTINPIIKIKKIKKKIYNKKFNLTWIGRNSIEKNLVDFSKSIDLIKNKNFKINIVSNKDVKDNIKKIVSNENFKKISFFNFKNDRKFMDKIYYETDIYISTSIYEGFPNTIVEAITFECLIISSKSHGGLMEIIKNNKFGLLYKTHNYIELSKRINFAINNFNRCRSKIIKAKDNLINKSLQNNRYKKFFNSI